jgi:type IV pilus assembly protein PilE
MSVSTVRPLATIPAGSPGGFTLIELMITLAIIAIIATIALPQYGEYATRSRITEATGNLAARRARLELHYDNNHTYATAPDAANDTTSSKYFDFACVCNTDNYVVTATGKGAMTGFGYTIDQNNAKGTTAVPSGWTKSTTCWTIKKDGSC